MYTEGDGTVDRRTFWTGIWDKAEQDGETLRVGEYRSAPVGLDWGVLKDNAEYPNDTGILKSQQAALDWMVETVRERQREAARRDR